MAALFAVALLAAAGTAAAQQRSLRITDGDVYIDDRLVPPEQLPSGLQTDGITVQYTFSGNARPVVQLGDEFYVLDSDELRVARMDERASPFFNAGPFMKGFTPPGVQVQFRTDPRVPDHAVVFERKAEELMQRAKRLQELQRHLHERALQPSQAVVPGRPHAESLRELEALAREMSTHAVEAARVAGDLPRIERESYLQDIQQMNEALFDQLVNERDMERETLEMAMRIRSMAEGGDRDRLVEELRGQLHQIFELKQQNRRREVEQLERRLEDLQGKLEERERMRDEVVEHRLRELLGEGSAQW